MLMPIADLAAPSPMAVARFDPDRAAALSQALGALADALDRANNVELARYPATVVDWAGFTRRWFEHQHHGLVAELRQAAASAREEAMLVMVAPAVGP